SPAPAAMALVSSSRTASIASARPIFSIFLRREYLIAATGMLTCPAAPSSDRNGLGRRGHYVLLPVVAGARSTPSRTDHERPLSGLGAGGVGREQRPPGWRARHRDAGQGLADHPLHGQLPCAGPQRPFRRLQPRLPARRLRPRRQGMPLESAEVASRRTRGGS